jgi:hypothetical protein
MILHDKKHENNIMILCELSPCHVDHILKLSVEGNMSLYLFIVHDYRNETM